MNSNMNLHDNNYGGGRETKQRIVQELVPGKQVTLAHIIANPEPILFEKLGLNPITIKSSGSNAAGFNPMKSDSTGEYTKSSIGILNVSPAETTIIMADIAVKASGAELGFVDRFSGSLIINGSVSEVEAAVNAILEYVQNTLGYTVCAVTKT